MPKHAKQVAPNVTPLHESPAATGPDDTKIAALAYQLWLERGCPLGSAEEDWFRAEAMLKSNRVEPVRVVAASA